MWVRRRERTTKATSSNETTTNPPSQTSASSSQAQGIVQSVLSKTRTLSDRVKLFEGPLEEPDEWGSSTYLNLFVPPANTDTSAPTNEIETEITLNEFSRTRLIKHLQTRNVVLPSTSNIKKQHLVQMLLQSLKDEREAQEALANKHFRRTKTLEEMGAVYAVGRNDLGQCGVGVNAGNRGEKGVRDFTVIPMTRGLGVEYVTCGEDCTFAVSPIGPAAADGGAETTQDLDKNAESSGGAVYTWGGVHVGPTGIDQDSEGSQVASTNRSQGSKALQILDTPQIIPRLVGEQITQVSVGKSHACAISSVGDAFVWGFGKFGALGLGDQNMGYCKSPLLLNNFEVNATATTEDIRIQHVSCGDNHSCAVTTNGTVYSWGYASHGRLGLGKDGCAEVGALRRFVDHPSLVKFPFSSACIVKVSCGSEHCLAISKQFVLSWGSGDGGRLGHGDCLDRWSPELVGPLKGMHVIDVSAATWHSACVVVAPPIVDAGQVYTWGTGMFGQLGRNETFSLKPTAVDFFVKNGTTVKTIACGSHHNAVITSDDQLYTFGSNNYGCLGRNINEKYKTFTSEPGICGGFGALANRIGRGLVRTVACGKEFTIVATQPYKGPNEEEAKRISEENALREEAERTRAKELEEKRLLELEHKKQVENAYSQMRYLTSRRLCSLDCNCPGFQVHASKSFICRECGHSSVYHTIVVDDENSKGTKIDGGDNNRDSMGSRLSIVSRGGHQR